MYPVAVGGSHQDLCLKLLIILQIGAPTKSFEPLRKKMPMDEHKLLSASLRAKFCCMQ